MHCNQEPATILNHIKGSSNQVEVTSKIYVANSGIRNQTSTIIPVTYYHVICKSLLKLAIRIAGQIRNQEIKPRFCKIPNHVNKN